MNVNHKPIKVKLVADGQRIKVHLSDNKTSWANWLGQVSVKYGCASITTGIFCRSVEAVFGKSSSERELSFSLGTIRHFVELPCLIYLLYFGWSKVGAWANEKIGLAERKVEDKTTENSRFSYLTSIVSEWSRTPAWAIKTIYRSTINVFIQLLTNSLYALLVVVPVVIKKIEDNTFLLYRILEVGIKLLSAYINSTFYLYCAEAIIGSVEKGGGLENTVINNARVVYALASLAFGSYAGWSELGSFITQSIGLTERKVVDNTIESQQDEPGFIKKSLSRMGKGLAGMVAGGIAAHFIMGVGLSLLLTIECGIQKPTNAQEAVFRKNLVLSVQIGQLIGLACTLLFRSRHRGLQT